MAIGRLRGGEVSGGHLKLSDMSHFTEDDQFYQALKPCLQLQDGGLVGPK